MIITKSSHQPTLFFYSKMALKFKGIDVDLLLCGFVITFLLYFMIFATCGLCYNLGFTNFYEQTFMSNYTQWDLPVGVQAYYGAKATINGLIYGSLLALWISLGIYALFVITAIINGFTED